MRVADNLDAPDYVTAFAVGNSERERSPEQWARLIFENADRVLRWFVVLGWKTVLGLKLGPRGSAEHVLGWRIHTTLANSITLEARSALMTAHKVVQVDDSRVTVATLVRYDRRWARAVWAVVAPVHHRTEPLLLARAAARPPSR